MFLIRLLEKVTFIFPDKEVIIAVNGHTDKENQLIYLEDIRTLAASYPNVRIITFIEPQGLSKLWNQIIIKATAPRVFMLNDDINFSPYIRHQIETTNFFNERIALINGSFSFFTITKELLKELGGFDERLLEIGGEDDDFCVRMALRGYPYPPIYNLKYVKNLGHVPKVNSFGKNPAEESNKYSTYNDNFLKQKWDIRDYQFDDSVFSRGYKYWKLREEMKTPDFCTALDVGENADGQGH